MKHILTILTILTCLNAQAQDDCTDNFAAIHVSYIAPKSAGAGIEYFTELGLTGGIGAAYTKPRHYTIKQGANEYQMQTNSFDIYAHVGWRILRVDYLVSVFGNVGYTMGDVENFQPFTSLKLLFPVGTKAVSVEPVYVFGRGIAGKVSFHFKF